MNKVAYFGSDFDLRTQPVIGLMAPFAVVFHVGNSSGISGFGFKREIHKEPLLGYPTTSLEKFGLGEVGQSYEVQQAFLGTQRQATTDNPVRQGLMRGPLFRSLKQP